MLEYSHFLAVVSSLNFLAVPVVVMQLHLLLVTPIHCTHSPLSLLSAHTKKNSYNIYISIRVCQTGEYELLKCVVNSMIDE